MLSIRLLSALLSVTLQLAAASADPLPAEIFAALPEIEGARLSPGGKAVAMISAKGGRQGVRIWHSDGEVDWYMPAGGDLINWVTWKGDDRVLMSLRATEFEQGSSSQPVGLSRLVFAELASRQSIRVAFHEPAASGHILVIGREAYRPPNVQDRVISLLPGDPQHILISAANSEDWAHANALLVDVRDGAPALLLRSTDRVVKWIADASGAVRVKTTLDHREESSILLFWARDDDHADWRMVHRYELDVGERFIPLAFAPHAPDDLLVLADQPNGRLALRTLNVRSATMGPVLAADPQCDIEPVERDSQVVGYRDSCQGQEETYFDGGWQKDQAMLRHALKIPLVEIVDRTPDGRYALVKTMASTTAPPVFWYFDQSADHAKTLVRIGQSNEGLKPEMAAPAKEVSITARDGLVLPAFLTLPPDHGDEPLPFVVMPHGGPTAHDSLQYDWIVQFIASRGFGVLQPQYRGSTGYGAAFQRAGYRQWGARMQDDVTDATSWLIDQKLADPNHICIVGSSYGGYSALIGAARHPELYQGAAAIAPVTDMGRLMRDRDHSEFGDINHRRVMGNMESAGVVSPVDLAPEIAVPVLLIHGRRDFTVPAAHTEAMETALRRAGHSPTVVYLKDTDHFFSDEEGRLRTLKALDGFLSAVLSAARTPRS